jgi:hypothetical protein
MTSVRVAAVVVATAVAALLLVPTVSAANGEAHLADGAPGAVSVISARTGGGSGEVELTWGAVADASGYRVLRSDGVDGDFEVTAELDVTTGTATASADVVNVFSEEHSYIPPGGGFEGPDQSSQFSYVDLGDHRRCFRVIAVNAAGDAPPSDVACGAPPGAEPEPPTTTTTTVVRGQPSITVSPSTIAPGGDITISGNVPLTGDQSCPSGDGVRLTSISDLFPPDGFGPEVARDTNGDFETTYTVPLDTAPGTYRIGMRCGGGNVGISTTVQVVRPARPATPVPGQPTFTG